MAFDLQGHRGARGLAPENTLAGFARALEIGVTTLETDLAVTKDGVVVLSHDPVLNPDIVRGPMASGSRRPGPAIHSLTLAELKRYDVGRIKPGTKYAQQFAGQKPADGAAHPHACRAVRPAKSSGKTPRFNIETKLSPDKPEETPDPDTFAQLVVEAVRSAGLADRTTIQSFDWRTLIAGKRLAPEIETVCLTYQRPCRTASDGGTPAALALARRARSCRPRRLGAAPGSQGGGLRHLVALLPRAHAAPAVAEAHALGLKVVPWTVNARDDLARIIDMKVDGLITDYPDRAREVMAAKGIALP